MKTRQRLPCDAPGCKRDAKFESIKDGKPTPKYLCSTHAAEKLGAHDVTLKGLT